MTAAPDLRDAAVAVARRVAAAGHEAWFAGGCVRDRLLGRRPKDYDVATDARPDEVVRLFPGALTVGAAFGVVVVPAEGGQVEVATFRADGRYLDGRRPEDVRFSDRATDAARRDFTVNGLFEDPESGRVVDHVGGLADLDARLLRAIGDPERRFREDHLRLLRCVRFAVELGFGIEPETYAAVRRLAPLAATVSAERVRDEIVKTLAAGRGRGLRLLAKTGLLGVVLPETTPMASTPHSPPFHPEGDVLVHTALALDRIDVAGRDPEEAHALLLAALLHDVGKPATRTTDADGRHRFHGHDATGAAMTRAILERLRFATRQVDRVEALVDRHMVFPNLPKMRPGRLREFLGNPDFPLHLSLHRADCGASHGDLSLADFCEERLASFRNEPVLPPPLVTGRDLLAAGYEPGPRMGEMLRYVRDLQLDGAVGDAAEAVRRVREAFPVPRPGTSTE